MASARRPDFPCIEHDISLAYPLRFLGVAAWRSCKYQQEKILAQSRVHDEYLHFLGHELRSPLTAVKTALEVLQDELSAAAQPADDASDGSRASADRLRMVELALRNVHRLDRTMDWSQDLLALAHGAPQARRCRVALEELLPPDLWEKLAATCDLPDDLQVDTDPCLCRMLLKQLAGVLEYDGRHRLAAVTGSVLPGRVVIALQAASTESDGPDPAPVVARTHLVSLQETGRVDPASDLDRLTSFLVSEHLLQLLGAELQVQDPDSGQATLCLTLPAAA